MGLVVVTTRKALEEILEALGSRRAWVVVGCAECAAVCQTGGSVQVEEMVEELVARGKTVPAAVSLASPCDRRLTRRDLHRVERELGQADGVLCLACGGGAQAVADVTGLPVVAGLDSHFLGTVERLGVFHEECSLCGDCVLNHTGGLCPVALCPKGLRNGPCEGSRGGRCDANPEDPCAWERIHARLAEQGRAASFAALRPAPDASPWGRPRTTRTRGGAP
ncbi:MAG: methylenetetrahydrofolate reductase C-terminal domain-containing protein [Deferrisomatales bacterium]|nr:methylenetetrahydrofolate reductase C-terminal domain-containing protein [Deferrisomatales bacterium]